MFCVIKVFDREGRARSVVFNKHMAFTRGTYGFYYKVWSLRSFPFTAGYLLVPQFTCYYEALTNYYLSLLSSLPTIFCIKNIAKEVSLF